MPLHVTKEDDGRLLQMLSAELESARNLLQLLEQEHQVLIKGEAEAIRSISAHKQTQIKLLSDQLLVRDRFLTAHQLPAGKEGTDLFIQQAPAGSATAKCWAQVQDLATRLNDRNEINGGIVALAQRHVSQALNILTCHTEQNSTYGPAGQQAGRAPQSLARA